MFYLFQSPIEKSTLEAWAKLADDIAKVAILAIPVILYGNDSVYLKLFNTFCLLVGIYACLSGGRLFRKTIERKDAR